MNKANPYAILFALCIILFFLGSWWLPITDPTESNYTLTAKEMLQANDYLSPRIYGKFWYDKPIFFYWELILAYGIFGVNEFASRFFPACFAMLGVFTTFYFGKKLYGQQVGLFAAIILAANPEYWYLSHAIITDMTLFCAISITLISFYFGYTSGESKYYYAAYAAAGIGILTKGPIAFCLPGLIIFIFLLAQGDLKHILKMRLLKGLPLCFGIAALWFLPMYFVHGSDFIENFFGVHNYLRATVSEHPEADVWYFYTAIFLAGFLPWNLPVIFGVIKNFWREKRFPSLDIKEKFLLIWALTVPIVFQCFATKYITYTLPYMMPIAIMFARFFVSREKLFKRMAAVMVIFFTVGVFAAIPFANDASGKELSKVLPQYVDDDTKIVSYRRKYSASLVFYTGFEIWRIERPDRIEKILPQEMSWTSLNVMPIMTTKDLRDDEKYIALVDSHRSDSFLKAVSGTWILIDSTENCKIYRRVSHKTIIN
ncbi:MAG: glycosyltransferase family 39 protein [Selenomonadaceae bacterium]|nr:glycosyltransferase family 39 protein [Selenomonadaceae bacterium]